MKHCTAQISYIDFVEFREYFRWFQHHLVLHAAWFI